jgi:nucleoside-diphosphate-sugar epimerase
VIAVTGANGYVGGRILRHLRAGGIDTIAFIRRPGPGEEQARSYALDTPLDPSLLDGIDMVVHAAYDPSERGEDARTVNFSGSLPLLDGLVERGARALLISSLSAFEGARSQYGRTKLELERAVLERGGTVLRPGLIFGAGAGRHATGGLFGAMVAALSGRALVPLIAGGWQRLFVTHDEHLCELVVAITTGQLQAESPLFAAHEVPTTLRAIAEQIARAHDRRLTAITVPTALAYSGLRLAEIAGLGVAFRSDSLRGLVNPIPLDQVVALPRSQVVFPPLTPELWLNPQV